MILKILCKKYTKEILQLLNKHNELYFSQINKKIPIHMGSLSRILNELTKHGLIEKRESKDSYKLPKSYYKLTEKGKKALIFYELENTFENLKDNQKIIINIVNSKNHNTINANKVVINQK